MARSCHLPEGQGQESHEHFEMENGDICCSGLNVLHFPGVTSLQQVFDAFLFYLSNMEISITERLGHVTNVRKDISGAVVLTVNKKQDANEDDGELVVTMRRAAFLKLHHPEFPVSPAAMQELGGGIAKWGNVMVKAVREILYASGR
ncbi:hypothetical protein BBO99_00005390 [Phytophthora kernoviae]|uniref:Uncharacterized protein n=2 Tax=Phytophthora kernoviae TaxID=325452 RepID=A0A3R7K1Q9_9STRA|nr:hypothetical protein G195_006163 [Phytophthora kernoviae 00238/432]KAG2523552.1 hypothetical protein JM16_005291 [Phytophthora kernoviae]KAG2525437.1 hypothetical protein JM18_004863 [Phytophthora kernoviae]RLN45422.1 hypothetical protein BBI17_005464 [Phytophthora kernoviae]RLN79278.1 hypothetical protein BBO99_00005390 [Phytophthora kernoviae]